jgi:DNA (cytosine-5)-methyltransferase 1
VTSVHGRKMASDLRSPSALISLFCGPGGFDAGFRQQGFNSILAIDSERSACQTFARNYPDATVLQADLSSLEPGFISKQVAELSTEEPPIGVIGGPPCQAFSRSNGFKTDNDPRAQLPRHYASILAELNRTVDLSFFVFENVLGLKQKQHTAELEFFNDLFRAAGFNIFEGVLDSVDFGVPQVRKRLFIVGLNRLKYPDVDFQFPLPLGEARLKVRDKLRRLPKPTFFRRGLRAEQIPHHPNHWCMQPKSPRFFNGTLKQGMITGRPFRVLSRDKPSWTVAYGNREVHIHPSGKRRLSVYEAMLLQGFPLDYVLKGTLSDQIRMVSDAVSPPVASALARSIVQAIGLDKRRRRNSRA